MSKPWIAMTSMSVSASASAPGEGWIWVRLTPRLYVISGGKPARRLALIGASIPVTHFVSLEWKREPRAILSSGRTCGRRYCWEHTEEEICGENSGRNSLNRERTARLDQHKWRAVVDSGTSSNHVAIASAGSCYVYLDCNISIANTSSWSVFLF